jgi:hypothetical protein
MAFDRPERPAVCLQPPLTCCPPVRHTAQEVSAPRLPAEAATQCNRWVPLEGIQLGVTTGRHWSVYMYRMRVPLTTLCSWASCCYHWRAVWQQLGHWCRVWWAATTRRSCCTGQQGCSWHVAHQCYSVDQQGMCHDCLGAATRCNVLPLQLPLLLLPEAGCVPPGYDTPAHSTALAPGWWSGHIPARCPEQKKST